MATASRVIRPDTIYRVSVAVPVDSPDLMVKSLITKGKHQIASAREIIDSGSSHHLLMKVIAPNKSQSINCIGIKWTLVFKDSPVHH